MIRGGTRANVIAAEAEVEVDARIQRMADAARLDRRFRALKPFDRSCRLDVHGGINRPPLERTAKSSNFSIKLNGSVPSSGCIYRRCRLAEAPMVTSLPPWVYPPSMDWEPWAKALTLAMSLYSLRNWRREQPSSRD